ncbi:MAG TPA: amino acid permease, partial [Anaerolineaceae bacterium]
MYEHEAQNNIFERTSEYMPKPSWRTWLIGRPLATADAPHQTIGKLIGLAVFSSDAMSSVAYGPQEIFAVLIAAGMGALPLALPVAVGIAVLLAILTFSYEQTIHAYPGGGGAYIVARDNLGELPAQTAGAALLTDYVLTVSVSISSGVAQIVSAYPMLYTYRVEIAVALIMLIMLINLRGVKESGATFAVPTYFFLVMMYVTVIIGLIRYLTGGLGVVTNPPTVDLTITHAVTLFMILRAFANGTSSVTGVEAISNGITAFKT